MRRQLGSRYDSPLLLLSIHSNISISGSSSTSPARNVDRVPLALGLGRCKSRDLYPTDQQTDSLIARQQLHHHQAVDLRRVAGGALRTHPAPARGQARHRDIQFADRTEGQRPEEGQDVSRPQEEPQSPLDLHHLMCWNTSVGIGLLSCFDYSICLVMFSRVSLLFSYRKFRLIF